MLVWKRRMSRFIVISCIYLDYLDILVSLISIIPIKIKTSVCTFWYYYYLLACQICVYFSCMFLVLVVFVVYVEKHCMLPALPLLMSYPDNILWTDFVLLFRMKC